MDVSVCARLHVRLNSCGCPQPPSKLSATMGRARKRPSITDRPQTVGGRNLWYGLDEQPITLGEANALLGSPRRIVARTDLGERFTVSTVFLVLDHQWLDGPPILYETMVFDSEGEGLTCRRYSTRAEASRGHDEEVADLRALMAQLEEVLSHPEDDKP